MIRTPHTFHIPVMGLGYTIDTPLKVARFGISSVVSIIEDQLVELMRKHYCEMEQEPYTAIPKSNQDHRAMRITAYLNLMNKMVARQMDDLRKQPFEPGNDIVKYFEMLPTDAPLRLKYFEMLKESSGERREKLQAELYESIVAGSIDVNIMTKCDRINYNKQGEMLPVEFADAMAALRGFAMSDLSSSVIFSAGMNPRLYTYCESFPDFFPDTQGMLKKQIILKVSDYRSALIQGKFLAKKGLWVSEFRIESGLNCGGHAFPTDGYLLGPIMEEFKNNKESLISELYGMFSQALEAKNLLVPPMPPLMRISVQGGIGTYNEDRFLREYYRLDATGWGSPFLLVPEVTNVDDGTLKDLSTASPADYFLSDASPLGIPFNNFKKSTGEKQRLERIAKGRPGSACYKQHLSFNTEFGDKPICSSSREYMHLKLKQFGDDASLTPAQRLEKESLLQKDCLCEGLAATALLKNHIPVPHNMNAVSICPGPNLAYFSGVFSMKDMIDHIYGRTNLLNKEARPSMFLKELRLYVDYFSKEIEKTIAEAGQKKMKQLETFKANLIHGIDYYLDLLPKMKLEAESYLNTMAEELNRIRRELDASPLLCPQPV